MTTKSAPRGEYAKTALRRRQIIDAASQVFGRAGFLNASLGEIATRAGISIAGLNHHFATKTELLEAVFQQRDSEAEAYFSGGSGIELLRALVDVAERDQANPEATRFFAIMAAEATAPDHPANAYFARRYEFILRAVEGAFRAVADAGKLRPGVDPADAARAYVALSDGLQVQRLYQPGAFSQAGVTRRILAELLTEPL